MQLDFHKMHGAGNDFVVLDARDQAIALRPGTVAALACRRTGIGFDQLVLVARDDAPDAVFVRFFNADGSESGACGNASRCIGWLVGEGAPGAGCTIRTVAGLLPAQILSADADGNGGQVTVRFEPPRFDWRDVPLSRAADTLHLPLPGDPAGCSMGNPHATFFDPALDPSVEGPRFERDALFPEGANIGFATVLAPDRMRLRVFERGAGLTLACGSGACAAVVNAARRGLCGRDVTVLADGGTLRVRWDEDGVHLSGPTRLSFTGTVDLDAFEARALGPGAFAA
ncbi:diaminopimelate epimerase [Acetobacteraceae bacterium KSS8]|uniref:Diaminopimelate epimerase n=1 Tax=Endosaccharibacter trunci TaxID=2812733 RepID=A0ABT1W638_9PROT|nr:diaminopimelate epimerase [Acetobacteraceae bacterium KSS8]